MSRFIKVGKKDDRGYQERINVDAIKSLRPGERKLKIRFLDASEGSYVDENGTLFSEITGESTTVSKPKPKSK